MTLDWLPVRENQVESAYAQVELLFALASGCDDGGSNVVAEHLDWLVEVKATQPATQGLQIGSVPDEWHAACLWAGFPMAEEGQWLWDDIAFGSADSAPSLRDNQLILPSDPTRLLTSNGVELKPVRDWIGNRCDLRLQAAPGLGFFLWDDQAVIVSMRDCPLAGFLHGPTRGQRHVLALPPGGSVHISFR